MRGGRLGETGGAMNKKRIQGRSNSTSGHHTAKSSRFSCGGKSDVRAGKQRVLTWGDPAEGNLGGKSAEVVVGGNKPGAFTRPLKLGNRKP